ncbi:hypothetical protein PVOR_01510 [Paenibacillus vortex V453]|uniref:Uncharacterized protein n=1 Tax=Paenibacillus vortex V453 TaxID=715225 RepID=A0A2R9T2P0_9BACL|nr:hypothetical protein [Paenibacillus vortex]EFU43847.1 hypothetical protein PVOR_01510 [Paenibacillus vortex V453]
MQPLITKFFPSIQMSKLPDEEVQAIFFYGQQDIRFGLLIMNWDHFGGDDELREILAIDSSSVGVKLFVDYGNLDQVKHDLIDVWSNGPFED